MTPQDAPRCAMKPEGMRFVTCQRERGHKGMHLFIASDGTFKWRWERCEPPTRTTPRRIPTVARERVVTPPPPPKPVLSNRAQRRAERDHARLLRRFGNVA